MITTFIRALLLCLVWTAPSGFCSDNVTDSIMVNATSNATDSPSALLLPQAAAQKAQPREDPIHVAGLTFDSQSAFDHMTMLRPPPLSHRHAMAAASMLRPAVVALYPRNPSSASGLAPQQAHAASPNKPFPLGGYQEAPEIIRGTPIRMPSAEAYQSPMGPTASASNLAPIMFHRVRPQATNLYQPFGNDMRTSGTHMESRTIAPGYQPSKDLSGHVQLQKNIAEQQHFAQVMKSMAHLKQQQQYKQQLQQQQQSSSHVKSFLPAMPQHVPVSHMSPFLQPSNDILHYNRPTPIHPGFPAPGGNLHTGQLYPVHPLRGPQLKDMIKFSIDDHVPTASESKMWRMKAPADLLNSFPKDQDTSSSEESSSRKRVLDTSVKTNSTTALPRKKATLKDILAEDCPGADEFGYCASPPRYPSHQVGVVLNRCSNSIKNIYAPLPEGTEEDGIIFSNDTISEKTKSKWAWNHNSKQFPLCESDLRRVEPGYGRDANDGRWYVVIQNASAGVTQRVLVDVCREAGHPCAGLSGTKCSPSMQPHPSGSFRTPSKSSICKQKFTYDRLMTWDPDRPEDCPKIRVFRFPTACVCHLPPY